MKPQANNIYKQHEEILRWIFKNKNTLWNAVQKQIKVPVHKKIYPIQDIMTSFCLTSYEIRDNM